MIRPTPGRRYHVLYFVPGKVFVFQTVAEYNPIQFDHFGKHFFLVLVGNLVKKRTRSNISLFAPGFPDSLPVCLVGNQNITGAQSLMNNFNQLAASDLRR